MKSVEAAGLLARREAWLKAVLWPAAPGSQRALVVLPREELSAHTARVLATAMCWDEGGFDVADVAQVVGELVNNAVLHTAPPPGAPDAITVAIIVTDEELRIGVGDLGAKLPVGRRAKPATEHGRGLPLVTALCDRHHVEEFDGGKVVWACWDLNR